MAEEGQCFALETPEEQVDCFAENLNITDPPSIYSFVKYPQLWEPITCLLWNVTLSFRVDEEGKGIARMQECLMESLCLLHFFCIEAHIYKQQS